MSTSAAACAALLHAADAQGMPLPLLDAEPCDASPPSCRHALLLTRSDTHGFLRGDPLPRTLTDLFDRLRGVPVSQAAASRGRLPS